MLSQPVVLPGTVKTYSSGRLVTDELRTVAELAGAELEVEVFMDGGRRAAFDDEDTAGHAEMDDDIAIVELQVYILRPSADLYDLFIGR